MVLGRDLVPAEESLRMNRRALPSRTLLILHGRLDISSSSHIWRVSRNQQGTQSASEKALPGYSQ